jgi:hypothetical protein
MERLATLEPILCLMSAGLWLLLARAPCEVPVEPAYWAWAGRACPLPGVDQRLRARVLPLNKYNDFLKCCLVAPQHGNVVRSRRAEQRIRQAAGDVGKPTRACGLDLAEQRQARACGLEARRMLCMVYRDS